MTPPRTWTVSLADDHPLVLRGLADLIASRPDFSVLAVSSDGEAAIAVIHEKRPDLAVLDVNMPKLSGLEVLRRVTREQLPTRIVFLTASLADERMLDAINLGVHGIVFKDSAPESLLECLDTVVAGERWLASDFVKAALAREAERREDGQGGDLTQREVEIMRLVTIGLANKQIARRLDLSEGTVKVHLHNVYRKLNLNSRTALAAYALARRSGDGGSDQ
jgi:DNA-binding NarL/FixJ family response regulator